MTLGSRIKEARKRLKLSQAELGSLIDVTSQAISAWETNKNDPEAETLRKLALALHEDVTFLLTGTQPLEGLGYKAGTEDGSGQVRGGRVIPLVDMKYAGATRPAEHAVGYIHTHFPCSALSRGILIDDDANSDRFLPGDQIVIDPEREAKPGNMVLAVVQNSVVFRRYALRTDLDGATFIELQPLNPHYPTLYIKSTSDGQVVGPMTEHAQPAR